MVNEERKILPLSRNPCSHSYRPGYKSSSRRVTCLSPTPLPLWSLADFG